MKSEIISREAIIFIDYIHCTNVYCKIYTELQNHDIDMHVRFKQSKPDNGSDCRGLLGAPGCLSCLPIRMRDRFFRSPSWISFLSCGICIARSRKAAVKAGLWYKAQWIHLVDRRLKIHHRIPKVKNYN